jgi:hypothetical protein
MRSRLEMAPPQSAPSSNRLLRRGRKTGGGSPDCCKKLVFIERLVEDLRRPELRRASLQIRRGRAGHDRCRDLLALLAKSAEYVKPRHDRQLVVDEQELEPRGVVT